MNARWLLLMIPLVLPAVDAPPRVYEGKDGAAEIALPNGKKIRIPKRRWEAGIEEGWTADDGQTVGWLVTSKVEGVGDSPIPLELVVWRGGKIVRRFPTGQCIYSWSFYAGGKQVAYHIGPLHFELESYCELREVATGRLIAKWSGDLEAEGKPAWTRGLTR